jgi:acyl carrier protein
MPESKQVRNLLRQFVVDNFLLGSQDVPFGDEDSFVGSGIIDSTGIMELVAYLEEKFDVELDDTELIPDNLDSVSNVDRFIRSKRAAALA